MLTALLLAALLHPHPRAQEAPAVSSIRIVVGELVFDARAAGPEDGEPVLLLHGFPQTSYSWRHQLEALAAAGYRAVAPDQRGYSPGARPTEVAQYALPHLVGDVAGIADALGFDTFHLVGHDWGGAVAWVFSMQHPGRLRTLTVVSTPHVSALSRARSDPASGQAERSAYMKRFAEQGSEQDFLENDAARLRGIYAGAGLSDAEVQVYVDALGTPEAMRAALNWYSAMGTGSGRPAPAPASARGGPPLPTLYVWGTEDMAFTRVAAEGTRDFAREPYRFEALDGIGHWVPEQAAPVLDALLLEHLESASAGD